MSIEINNLFKYYGEQAAVKNVSFSIPKGQVVGFLGPNGAGKSTTMKIITGFIPSTYSPNINKSLNVDKIRQDKIRLNIIIRFYLLKYTLIIASDVLLIVIFLPVFLSL